MRLLIASRAAVSALLLWSVACEPEGVVRTFVYENQTPYQITVYLDGKQEVSLQPQEVKRVRTFVRPRRVFEARDGGGRTLFRLEASKEELERVGWRIAIMDQMLTPRKPAEESQLARFQGQRHV